MEASLQSTLYGQIWRVSRYIICEQCKLVALLCAKTASNRSISLVRKHTNEIIRRIVFNVTINFCISLEWFAFIYFSVNVIVMSLPESFLCFFVVVKENSFVTACYNWYSLFSAELIGPHTTYNGIVNVIYNLYGVNAICDIDISCTAIRKKSSFILENSFKHFRNTMHLTFGNQKSRRKYTQSCF